MSKQTILPEAVTAAGYKVSKDAPVKFFDPNFGDIDFTELSLDQAEALVAAGHPHLVQSKKSVTAPNS